MKMTWLPIPRAELGDKEHKLLIAHIERRLLWKECLDPKVNSNRVKKNSTFTLAGKRYSLEESIAVGDQSFLTS
jgi:hypothetical protein